MNQPRILIFIDWFLPGYKAGGQIPSVANLVRLLHTKYEFFIFTRNTDLGDNSFYHEIKSNTWLELYNAKIFYAGKHTLNFKTIKKIIREINPQIIYFNSLFSTWFTLVPLILLKRENIKIVLAPRGMLGKGALSQKATKKVVFLIFAKLFSLFKKITWHASSDNEKQEIIHYFGNKQSIKVAMDLSSIPNTDFSKKVNKITNECHLFFLSRISPKKNLKYCIEILKQISDTKKIRFTIIGPLEDVNYWKECMKGIKELPSHITIKYQGEIPNSEINQMLVSNFHFLFFPTLHENYGHVIIESLSAGCPVIISDQTPWHFTSPLSPLSNWRGTGCEVGWDISLDKPEEFVKVLEYCAAMGQEEYDQMSRNAFEYAQKITNETVLEANRKLFE